MLAIPATNPAISITTTDVGMQYSQEFAAPGSVPTHRSRQGGYAAIAQQLRGSNTQPPNPEEEPAQRARTAAEQLVSVALVQPMLKRARESNNAAPPFGANKGSKTLGGMLDAAYAAEITSSSRWGLIDSVAKRMMARVAPPQRAMLGTDGIGRQDAAFARE